MKKRRYRLRKKYRLKLKRLGQKGLIILCICVGIQALMFTYQTFFSKDEVVEEMKDKPSIASEVKPYDIIIDAGHGGRDSGCEWENIKEKDITLDIARQVAKKLQSHGFHVYMTRNDDSDFDEIEDYDLIKRVEIGEEINPKLFVSIHVNFSEYEDAQGCEVFYNSNKTFAAQSAQIIADEMNKSNILTSRGASETLSYNPIYIVDYNDCETVLIETAFLSNENDRNILSNTIKRVQIADVIEEGIYQSMMNDPNE